MIERATVFFKNILLCLNEKHNRILIGIILIGFILRFWGIWNIEQTDEFNEIFEALKVNSGRLNLERWNKKVLIYIMAVEYGVYYLIGLSLGIYSSIMDFSLKIVSDMRPLFIIGRINSVLFGTLIILFTYKIGTLLFNRDVGIVSALILCFNMVHIEHSHLALVDITMSLFVLITFYLTLSKTGWHSRRRYFWIGFFSSISIAAKVPSVFILLSIISMYILILDKKKIDIKKSIMSLVIGGLVGTIVGNPGIILAPQKYLDYLLSLIYAYDGTEQKVYFFTKQNGYLYYLNTINQNIGIILVAFFIIGFVYIKIYTKKFLHLLSFSLPFFIFMGNSKWFLADRYLIPIFPFVSIISGAGVYYTLNKLKFKKALYPIVATIIIVFMGRQIVEFELSLFDKNTRYIAKNWIENEIKTGSKILIDSGRTINTYSPPINQSPDNIKKIIEEIEALAPGKSLDESRIADNKSAYYFKLLLMLNNNIYYDLYSTNRGENVKDLDFYLNGNYDYIITSDLITWRTKIDEWRKEFPQQAAFYNYLEGITPIKEFKPSRFQRGPIIKIYDVKHLRNK